MFTGLAVQNLLFLNVVAQFFKPVQVLVTEGKANVKAVGKDSWTALHFCAQNKAGKAGAIDFAHDVLVEAGESDVHTDQNTDALPPKMCAFVCEGCAHACVSICAETKRPSTHHNIVI